MMGTNPFMTTDMNVPLSSVINPYKKGPEVWYSFPYSPTTYSAALVKETPAQVWLSEQIGLYSTLTNHEGHTIPTMMESEAVMISVGNDQPRVTQGSILVKSILSST